MILYTSDIDVKKRAAKTAVIYLLITILTALFGAVYEKFSHGVYSYFMIYAFGFPLLLGVLPYSVIAFLGIKKYPSLLTAGLYHSGVAAFAVGSIIQGVLEIYGTSNDLVFAYPVIGIILIVCAVVFQISNRNKF